MNFPEINGVEEGSIVIFACAIASGWYGNVKFWTQTVDLPLFGETKLNDILNITTIFFIYSYAASGLYQIFYSQDKPHFKKIYRRSTFVSLVFFWFFGTAT